MERVVSQLSPGTPLLLHACCAPCASAVIGRLAPHFRLTVFFYNPNFDTEHEYLRRKMAMEQLLEKLPQSEWPVEALFPAYDPAPFLRAAKGKETAPEGSARCDACFELRLAETARMAAQQGFEWMCTTLTVSPHKNAERINAIGAAQAEAQGLRFLPADFKKKGGFAESIRLSAQFGLYRQNYCGCAYSFR